MENLRIGPEKTFALIVGIDKYAQGEDWDLNNPANEAVMMVKWLLGLGVPAHRISCFVTGGQQRGEKLTDANGVKVQCQEPVGNAIRAAIRNPVYGDRIDDSNLIFYWAGHGQLGSKMEQLLYDPAYKKSDQQVFDLSDVRDALQSDDWTDFKKQIILINACARYDSNNDHNFNKHQFNGLKHTKRLDRKQFILCAAPPGLRTPDGSPGTPSHYFQNIYDALNKVAAGSFSDESFSKHLHDAIEKLNPIPRFELINFKGDRFLYDSDDPLNYFIWEKLNEIGERLSRYQEINYKWMNGIGESADLFQMASSLRGANENHPKRLSHTNLGHLVDFFLHVIAEFGLEDLYEEMKKVVKDQKTLKLPTLIEARERVIWERMKPEPPFFLSVSLTTEPLELRWYLHHKNFEFFRDGAWQPQNGDFSIIENFRDLYLQDLEIFLAEQEEEDVTFRFYFKNEHMIEIPIHDLADPRYEQMKRKLAHKSPVIVASFERARGQRRSDSGRWKKWCRKVSELKESEVSFGIVPVELVGADLEKYHWIAIDGVPTLQTLRNAIEQGLPFMVWPYSDDSGWDGCLEALQELKFSPEELAQAHGCFRQFRKEYSHLGVVVFWDDAARNPIPQQEQFPGIK